MAVPTANNLHILQFYQICSLMSLVANIIGTNFGKTMSLLVYGAHTTYELIKIRS